MFNDPFITRCLSSGEWYVTTFQSFRAFFTEENIRWFLKPCVLTSG